MTSRFLSVLALLTGSAPLAPLAAQAAPAPQPTCITNVSLDRSGTSESRHNVILRDGRIDSIVDAGTPVPPGSRIVDGEGLLLLPAFLDAYTRTGCETPEPVKDQDVPVDAKVDVRVDMRMANRKGIQPAFRAAEALAIEDEASEAWREAGFGAAHVAPGGQLLAGSSSLVATREAAARDVVIESDVFASAAFQATGPGYPSTLMGYIAQLRQFFLDCERHRDQLARRADGRPGPRPPFDAELEHGAELIGGERRLLCEAQGSRDMERWLKLADEFGLRIAFSGGRDAWRVADDLAARDVPVVLTLEWGKEVDDPLAEQKKESDEQDEPSEPEQASEPEDAAEEEAEPTAEAQEPGEDEAEEDAEGEAEEDAVDWEYQEPLVARVERRRLWEEKRDCALRLAESGVPFAFGTAKEKPEKLLERVRTLVEEGLPAEAALAGLTSDAAAMLGVADRLGKIARGYDATLTLWSADPLTDDKAQAAWIFVDGFPTEFEVDAEEAGSDEGPAEGVDATGTWSVEIEGDDGPTEAELILTMQEDGAVTGKFKMKSPMDGSDVEAAV